MVEIEILSADRVDALAGLVSACDLGDWIDEAALMRYMLAHPTSPPEMRLLAIQDGEASGLFGAA